MKKIMKKMFPTENNVPYIVFMNAYIAHLASVRSEHFVFMDHL